MSELRQDSIIDLSHHNAVTSFIEMKNAGIVAIIHKATQGISYQDPKFALRAQQAAASGLLFGAYHFGSAGDGQAQAEHFLSVAGNDRLLALDFERNSAGDSMTLAEAERFVLYIKEHTGRYPGLYGGSYLKEQLATLTAEQQQQSPLQQCWLWIAQYANAPTWPKLWTNWTLWQHTDGQSGLNPTPVAGVGACDRDMFNGTAEQLLSFWQQQCV